MTQIKKVCLMVTVQQLRRLCACTCVVVAVMQLRLTVQSKIQFQRENYIDVWPTFFYRSLVKSYTIKGH